MFLLRNFEMPFECVLGNLPHTHEIITNWLMWQLHGNYFQSTFIQYLHIRLYIYSYIYGERTIMVYIQRKIHIL